MFNKDDYSNPFTRMTNGSLRPKQQDKDQSSPGDSNNNNKNGKGISSNSYTKESPLSQLSWSPASLDGASELHQSHVYKTALEYPMRAASTEKGIYQFGTMLQEVEEEEADDIEDSPLFPNWDEKIPMSTFKQQGILRTSPGGNQGNNLNPLYRNHKSGANLISSIVNGSPFQNINSIAKNQSPFNNGWSDLSQVPSQGGSNQSAKFGGGDTGSTSLNHADRSTAVLSEKNVEHSEGVKIKHRSRKLTVGVIMLLFSMMIPLTLITLLTSCRSVNGVCFPQFSVQLDNSSPHAAETLTSAREALKVLSYIAIDLGSPVLNSADLVNDSSYLNTVDTFSYENVYGLSYHGYCRQNLVTGSRFCTGCQGLDIIATLVRDAGIQFAKIVKRQDFKTVGNSFVLAYKVLLKNIEDSENKSDLVKKANLVSVISSILAYTSLGIFCLSSINLLYLAILLFMIIIKRPVKIVAHLKMHALALILFHFAQFAIIFFICAVEFEYVYQLSEVSSLAGIAIVGWDWGIYILLFDLFMSGVLLFLSMVFYKVMRK